MKFNNNLGKMGNNFEKIGKITRLEPSTIDAKWSTLAKEFGRRFEINLNTKEYELAQGLKYSTKTESKAVFKKETKP